MSNETTTQRSNRPVQVIGVTSGKGGVGKTNLSVNLAVSLSQLGQRVLIIDADLGLANVDILLDESPKATLHDVVTGAKSLDEVVMESSFGVSILPGASGVTEMTDLDVQQRMRLLNAVDSLEDRFDTLIVDTPAGIGSNAAFFASAVQEILVVATPEPTSMTDAYAMIKVLNKTHGVERFGLVLNQVMSVAEAQDVYMRLNSITSRFLSVMVELHGWLPIDPSVRSAVMAQKPVTIQYPNAPYPVAVRKLAEKLLMRPNKGSEGRLQFFWNRLLGSAQAQAGGI
jgi:flagellar biosynthesis protein FlhG